MIAFQGWLQGPGINGDNDVAIWAGPTNALQLAGRKGDQVPGMSVGVLFDALSDPVLNHEGEVFFIGQFSGPGITDGNNGAFFVGPPGNVLPVLQEGDPADGLGAGVVHGNSAFGFCRSTFVCRRQKNRVSGICGRSRYYHHE